MPEQTVPITGERKAVAPPESFFARHDVIVVVVGLVLLAIGLVVQAREAAPHLKTFAQDGVQFSYPASWLQSGAPGAIELRGEDAVTRLEVRTSPKPASTLVNVETLLELERGQKYGRLYQRASSTRRSLGGRDWLRTEYTYAFAPAGGGAPRVASAVEYAYPSDLEMNADKLTVVTLHGSEDRVHALEPVLARTLTVK